MMRNLISYLFIIFISLNLICSIYGWWQSNKEMGIIYNEHTEIIDTIWQTKNKKKYIADTNDKVFHLLPPPIISKTHYFIDAIIKAKPAFQHTYIEVYGFLHRILNRDFLEDNNKNNDIVRLPNGQLDFTSKLHNLYTSDNTSNDIHLATEQLKIFKEYIDTHSPQTETYFIIRPHKGYGASPYNLYYNNKYTKKNFIQNLKAFNYHVLDLNKNIPSNRHIAFYNTDHHWRIEYAFSQLPFICNFIGEDSSIYSSENFKLINTHRQFTGSLTKRTGNSFTNLTDTFKYYIPLFQTSFSADYYSNNHILRRTGKFNQVLLFLEKEQETKWDSNLYSICNQGDNPLVRIKNHNINPESSKKILLLGDSFSAPIISYLSLSVGILDCIDLRSCNPKILKKLINKNQYDKILLIYPDEYDKKMYNFTNDDF